MATEVWPRWLATRDPNNKYVTTYFRHEFAVIGVADVGELSLALQRDDGAAVYLNGVEIAREWSVFGSGFRRPGDRQR